MSSLARRAVAELYGTFVLIFFGCGAVVMEAYPNARYGLLGIALVHGVALAVAISSTMSISGGHLNPAVTIGLLSIRRIAPMDAFVYVLAQIAGALLGAGATKALLPSGVGNLVMWGTPTINATVPFWSGVGIEAVLTFCLMSAVMGTAVSDSAPKIGGFGIGLTLVFAIIVGGPLTGAALNPARATGPALMTSNLSGLGAYWIGPVLGAVIAALLWEHVLLKRETATA